MRQCSLINNFSYCFLFGLWSGYLFILYIPQFWFLTSGWLNGAARGLRFWLRIWNATHRMVHVKLTKKSAFYNYISLDDRTSGQPYWVSNKTSQSGHFFSFCFFFFSTGVFANSAVTHSLCHSLAKHLIDILAFSAVEDVLVVTHRVKDTIIEKFTGSGLSRQHQSHCWSLVYSVFFFSLSQNVTAKYREWGQFRWV